MQAVILFQVSRAKMMRGALRFVLGISNQPLLRAVISFCFENKCIYYFSKIFRGVGEFLVWGNVAAGREGKKRRRRRKKMIGQFLKYLCWTIMDRKRKG